MNGLETLVSLRINELYTSIYNKAKYFDFDLAHEYIYIIYSAFMCVGFQQMKATACLYNTNMSCKNMWHSELLVRHKPQLLMLPLLEMDA